MSQNLKVINFNKALTSFYSGNRKSCMKLLKILEECFQPAQLVDNLINAFNERQLQNFTRINHSLIGNTSYFCLELLIEYSQETQEISRKELDKLSKSPDYAINWLQIQEVFLQQLPIIEISHQKILEYLGQDSKKYNNITLNRLNLVQDNYDKNYQRGRNLIKSEQLKKNDKSYKLTKLLQINEEIETGETDESLQNTELVYTYTTKEFQHQQILESSDMNDIDDNNQYSDHEDSPDVQRRVALYKMQTDFSIMQEIDQEFDLLSLQNTNKTNPKNSITISQSEFNTDHGKFNSTPKVQLIYASKQINQSKNNRRSQDVVYRCPKGQVNMVIYNKPIKSQTQQIQKRSNRQRKPIFKQVNFTSTQKKDLQKDIKGGQENKTPIQKILPKSYHYINPHNYTKNIRQVPKIQYNINMACQHS